MKKVLFVYILVLISIFSQTNIFKLSNSNTIQELIDSANPGDTIYLTNPEYSECILINKPITLIGKGIDQTTITGDTLKPTITIRSNNVAIKNLTIAAKIKSTWRGGYCDGIPTNGIEIFDSQNIFLDSLSVYGGEDISEAFSVSGGIALLVENTQNIKILNSIIKGVKSKEMGIYRCGINGGEGIKIINSVSLKIFNCTATGRQGGNADSRSSGLGKAGYGGNALSLLTSREIEINNSHFIGGAGGKSGCYSLSPITDAFQAKAGDGAYCNESKVSFINTILEGGDAFVCNLEVQNVPNTLGGNGITVTNNSEIIFDGGNLIRGLSSEDANGGLFYADFTSTIEFNNFDPDILSVPYILTQSYPNPFNLVTIIRYSIHKQNFITLKVYDLLGREVATPVNEEKPSGIYETEFNGVDLPSGVYFYRLQAAGFVETKKMILLR